MQSSAPRPFLSLAAAGIAAALLAACEKPAPPKPAAPPAPSPAAAAPAPAPEKPATAESRPDGDRALAAKVKSALAAEPRLKAHQVDVVARDGKVTLFGTAETRALREAVEKAAAGVAGVKTVENKLVVVAGS